MGKTRTEINETVPTVTATEPVGFEQTFADWLQS